jgi:hypothetical protein
MDGVDGVLRGDLLDRFSDTDRLHGDPGLELGTMGVALAQLLPRRLRLRWEPLSEAVPRLRVDDRACPGMPDHLNGLHPS